jgi:hypothetical protein
MNQRHRHHDENQNDKHDNRNQAGAGPDQPPAGQPASDGTRNDCQAKEVMRTSQTTRPGTGTLSEHDRQAIRAAVAALPPLTDDQIEHLCEVINNLRARHRQQKVRPRQGNLPRARTGD